MIKTTMLLILITLIFTSSMPQTDFLTEQKRYKRVRTAITEKQDVIEKLLAKHDLKSDNINILIIAFKGSDELNLYAKNMQEAKYQKIKSYRICSRSGQLGPKNKQGDYQVPEGFYHIDRFNPSSNFYLSLGINYPNAADKKRSPAAKLGGDIFIHGDCVTIGCLPMTNDKIKEIYLMAVHAKNNGQNKIPVYIFPFKMSAENMTRYNSKFKNDQELIKFWENLKNGHDQFLKYAEELKFTVTTNGDYLFKKKDL